MTTFTMTDKTYRGAKVTVTIAGREYDGRMTNPAGTEDTDEWMCNDLLRTILMLPFSEYKEICEAIRAEFEGPDTEMPAPLAVDPGDDYRAPYRWDVNDQY